MGCGGRHVAMSAPTKDRSSFHVERGRLLFADDFRGDLSRWVIEQQPGGNVSAQDGRLVISDRGGCTVWWRQRLEGNLAISYEATVSSAARVSDLNAFWMASDPSRRGDFFAAGHGRDGRFDTYNGLLTYYVGCGGNNNSTTRFRRYSGDGARPLLPEHDLRAARFLLEADRAYRIELIACGDRVQYVRDGEVVFDVVDSEPLRAGWFAFRTVDSHIEIRDFRVSEARCP
jgi:hypothetical protein